MQEKKRKLKLVISDLHLGLGPSLENGQLNPLEEFYFDQKFAEFLNYYTTGEFRDSEVEVILNGDILNFLQVDFRGHYLTVITEQVTLEKVERIVDGHKVFFDALRNFAKQGNKITYVVGNHDQGILWPKVREYLDKILATDIQYKNIVYFFDGVHIEHGNMYESANRVNPRKFFLKKDLPEPILNLPFGSHFFVDYVMKIKEEHPHVDKIRPFDKMLKWSIINETTFTITGIIGLLFYFIKSIFVKDSKRAWSFQKILQVFLENAVFPDLSSAAKKILGKEGVHTVIFGHSHVYQYRQFGNNKEYFNTGTWTELTSLDIASLGRITKLTYVLIEYPDDDGQPRGRLKEWRGYHRIEEDIAL